MLERPLSGKAVIQEYPQNFHNIDQHGTSAFRPKPNVRLEWVPRAANDPKQTLKTREFIMGETVLPSSVFYTLFVYMLVVGWLTLSKDAPLKEWCNEHSGLGIVLFVFVGPLIIAAILL